MWTRVTRRRVPRHSFHGGVLSSTRTSLKYNVCKRIHQYFSFKAVGIYTYLKTTERLFR